MSALLIQALKGAVGGSVLFLCAEYEATPCKQLVHVKSLSKIKKHLKEFVMCDV